jgi:hypothetical protein
VSLSAPNGARRDSCRRGRRPWENAYSETFNGKLQDELLQGELFTSLVEARWLI